MPLNLNIISLLLTVIFIRELNINLLYSIKNLTARRYKKNSTMSTGYMNWTLPFTNNT